jgi:hypothetical protein
MTVGGEGYNISSIGGVSDLSQGLEVVADESGRDIKFGGSGLNGTLNGSGGSLCGGDTAGCNATLNGFLAGEGASHLGVSYTLGNTGFDNQIDGSAAFARADAASTTKAETSTLTTVKQDVPVVTQTWARWDQGPAVLGDAPKPNLERNSRLDRIENIGDRIPSWITYDRR